MSVQHSEACRSTILGHVGPQCDAGYPRLSCLSFVWEGESRRQRRGCPCARLREVLWLKAAGVGEREIAAATGCLRSTVQLCLTRAEAAGIGWPLPEVSTFSEEAARVVLNSK